MCMLRHIRLPLDHVHVLVHKRIVAMAVDGKTPHKGVSVLHILSLSLCACVLEGGGSHAAPPPNPIPLPNAEPRLMGDKVRYLRRRESLSDASLRMSAGQVVDGVVAEATCGREEARRIHMMGKARTPLERAPHPLAPYTTYWSGEPECHLRGDASCGDRHER